MPLNVRRLTSVSLVLLSFVILAPAQSVPASAAQAPATSGDVMRARISKSKAYIVVRNYNAAIYELENIRRETSDPAVHGVVNVLLMNSYLEQGDYKRAQDMLNEFHTAQKTTKPNAAANYMAVAGQIVKGARSRAERYKALGLNVADRTLPLEAINDLEKMRETLELVISQAKEIGADKARSADAMAMLEEASGSRSMLARDDYDSRRWKDEIADTREMMASSRSIVSAISGEPSQDGVPMTPTPIGSTVAANTDPTPTSPVVLQPVADTQPAIDREREAKPAVNTPSETTIAKTDGPIYVRSAPPTVKEPVKNDTPIKTDAAATSEPAPGGPSAEPVRTEPADSGPMDVGSLIAYATRQTKPVYPPAAKMIRTTGVVRVEVTVDEKGEVVEVQKTVGPAMLQSAAEDAVRKWKFKPFLRGGQPVKATGFVSFNFSL